jgi:hypothetical protein
MYFFLAGTSSISISLVRLLNDANELVEQKGKDTASAKDDDDTASAKEVEGMA